MTNAKICIEMTFQNECGKAQKSFHEALTFLWTLNFEGQSTLEQSNSDARKILVSLHFELFRCRPRHQLQARFRHQLFMFQTTQKSRAMTAYEDYDDELDEYGIAWMRRPLTPEEWSTFHEPQNEEGDFKWAIVHRINNYEWNWSPHKEIERPLNTYFGVICQIGYKNHAISPSSLCIHNLFPSPFHLLQESMVLLPK